MVRRIIFYTRDKALPTDIILTEYSHRYEQRQSEQEIGPIERFPRRQPEIGPTEPLPERQPEIGPPSK